MESASKSALVRSVLVSELFPPVLDLNIDGVELAFLKTCLSHVVNARTQAGVRSPLSPSSTFVSPTALDLKPKVDQTRLTKNYPDAYTDTYGLFSGAPFVFKTGAAWPKATDGPNAQPFLRELRPISNHPILSAWDGILTDAGAYLKGVGKTFNAVMALGFANIGAETAFCPLVVILGVEPETIEFEVAKSVAQYVKIKIIAKAGFDDIEVAIWEFTTSFSGAGPRLPSLDTELDRVASFRHPFASTLGIPIAPLKRTGHEGTLGMFMTRGDGTDLLGITAAHVVCPSQPFPDNKGLSEKSAESHHEDIVALGSGAYDDAVKRIETQIGNLQQGIDSEKQRITGLRGRLERGVVDTDGKITSRIEAAQRTVENAKDTIRELDLLHSSVTKYMAIADNRCIGRILFADPIGVSSDGPNGYTRDWAVLKMRKDSFGEDFQGNKIYIGKSPTSLIHAQNVVYLYFVSQATNWMRRCSWDICSPKSPTVRATGTRSMACCSSAASFQRANSSVLSSLVSTATPP